MGSLSSLCFLGALTPSYHTHLNFSVVYFVPKLIEEAVSQKSYTGADGGYAAGALGSNAGSSSKRHTVTFTVTAPRDLVHGVSVQRVLGSSDRVMPVLDQNEWSQ